MTHSNTDFYSLWLEDIPNHWELIPLKYLCKINPSKPKDFGISDAELVSFLPMENLGEEGDLNLDETRSLEEVIQGYTYFENDDVLLAKITPCFENGKGAVAQDLLHGVGFGTTELHVLRCGEKCLPQYVYYLTQSDFFRFPGIAKMQGAAGQKRLSTKFVENFLVPLPPIVEQQSICNFLAQEIERNALLVTKLNDFSVQMVKKRQTTIMTYLLQGVTSHSSNLDYSGCEWIGDIPKHWNLEFARWLFREIDERSEDGSQELLTVSHITGVTPRSEKDVNMFRSESLEGYKICQPGDLVINTLWAWMGAMGVAFQEGVVSPAYHVYRPQGDYDPRYIDYLVRLPNFAKEVTRYSKGVWSSRLRLYPDEFFKIVLPVPSIEEQREIVAFLDAEIAKLDELSKAVEETIQLLQERRSALIAAAVTGKIRVTE